MITTHFLDLTEAEGPFAYIDEGDPLVIPLSFLKQDHRGKVFQVNEVDLPLEIVMRQRASMIAHWAIEGKEEEIRERLSKYGMCVNSWSLPAGAEIRSINQQEEFNYGNSKFDSTSV